MADAAGVEPTLGGDRPRGPEAHGAPPDAAVGRAGGSLVVQTSFLGDMVLTTPLIVALARRGPVDVVATPASAPLLANNPAVRDVLVYDKRGAAAGASGLWRTARALRMRAVGAGSAPRGTAVAYLAQGSLRSAALALLAGVPERVGFSTSAGRRLYTRRVQYDETQHHAERLWRLAGDGERAPTADELRPRLYPGRAEVAAVDALLAEAGHAGEPLVALAPGSVWATKRWPHYAELAALLAPQLRLVLVGASADRGEVEAIRAATGEGRAIDAAGRLSLLASAELIRRCRVLVTNDSAPQHLASAVATPTLTVFGPTVPEFGFGPLAPGSRVVGHHALACRPCDRHGPQRCPLGHWRCMREISAVQIATLVRDILSYSTS